MKKRAEKWYNVCGKIVPLRQTETYNKEKHNVKTMKKFVLFALMGLMTLSCVSRQEADSMQSEIADLKKQVEAKDALIEEVFSSINTITSNLSEIKNREGILTISNEEISDTTALGRLQSDVDTIDKLLAENRARMEELEQKAEQLRKANSRIRGLEKLISDLNTQLDERDEELSNLKDRLKSMGAKINTLLDEVAVKEQEVELLTQEKSELSEQVTQTTNELYTGYYIVAPQKQLISDQIVVKRGFIGRTLVMNEAPNLALFTSADTRLLKTLPIGQKEVTLVTSHPEGSYWLVESESQKKVIESLVILDAEKFWSLSKILVVSHK